MDRPDWDTYFLNLASTVATRAACLRSQVGAVVVVDNRVIGTGYNGTPPGDPNCSDGGCPRGQMGRDEVAPLSSYENCTGLHAEVNALANCSTSARGGTIYVTREPCSWCVKVCRAAGVTPVWRS